MELTGIRDKHAFFGAIKQLTAIDCIEVKRSPGLRSSYALAAHFIRRDNIDKIDINKIDSDNHLSNIYLSYPDIDAKPSVPPAPAQSLSALEPVLDDLTHVVEPHRSNRTSVIEPHGLNRTGVVQPHGLEATHVVEPHTPDLTSVVEPHGYEFNEEESLLGRCVSTDELEDIVVPGKRSQRRSMQLKLINEAWAVFFPYTTPLGESSALKFLRMAGGYSEDVYYAFEQASKHKPESPVSYVEKVVEGNAKKKQEDKIGPSQPPSSFAVNLDLEEEYRTKQAKIDAMTEEEVMTPWMKRRLANK